LPRGEDGVAFVTVVEGAIEEMPEPPFGGALFRALVGRCPSPMRAEWPFFPSGEGLMIR